MGCCGRKPHPPGIFHYTGEGGRRGPSGQGIIADAVADLGRPDEIGQVFAGFQKYLYQPQAAA